ncbi:hypothetical protein B0H19DRAFT_1271641 [Mycena capillaripes]|nr:hypothetical protein B0H19DRAFT_1271641 [Mycena capillaripes]
MDLSRKKDTPHKATKFNGSPPDVSKSYLASKDDRRAQITTKNSVLSGGRLNKIPWRMAPPDREQYPSKSNELKEVKTKKNFNFFPPTRMETTTAEREEFELPLKRNRRKRSRGFKVKKFLLDDDSLAISDTSFSDGEEEPPRKRGRQVEATRETVEHSDQAGGIHTATFVIYSRGDDHPQTTSSLSYHELSALEARLETEGCVGSIRDPADAASWIEDNWENQLLASIRDRGYDGPLAQMFLNQPALALFGPADNPFLAQSAESLGKLSGFPVMIRPANDSPKTLLARQPDTWSSLRSIDPFRIVTVTDQLEDIELPEASAGGSNHDGRRDDRRSDHRYPNRRDTGSTDDTSPGESLNDGSHYGFLDGGGDVGESRGSAAGMDAAKNRRYSRRATEMDNDTWESQLHRTHLELGLKMSNNHTYPVAIHYNFKFQIDRVTESPIDRANLAQALSQPEVIALVDFKIESRPRETQIDRSYASIGFVAHRENSIIQRDFLDRGYNLPDKLYKHGQQQQIQKGLNATIGFSGGHPMAATTFVYNKTNQVAVEATDSKVMPRCLVESEIGDQWNEGHKSYASYNIAYEPQKIPLEPRRLEAHPLEVGVGMGINLHPPNYVDDIRRKEGQSIYEPQEVDLTNTGTPYLRPAMKEERKPGTISLAIATVQNKGRQTPRNLATIFPALFGPRYPTGPTHVGAHEYLARGWDATNNRWRSVLWPALDQHLRAADVERTPPVWHLERKVAKRTIEDKSMKMRAAKGKMRE